MAPLLFLFVKYIIYLFPAELSSIVNREMNTNKLLNDELMALKNATDIIQRIQTEASEQQVGADKIDLLPVNRILVSMKLFRRKTRNLMKTNISV